MTKLWRKLRYVILFNFKVYRQVYRLCCHTQRRDVFKLSFVVLFQRVKELEIENGTLKEKVNILQQSSVIYWTILIASLKPWPNGIASRGKLKLGSTCDFVWPPNATTCEFVWLQLWYRGQFQPSISLIELIRHSISQQLRFAKKDHLFINCNTFYL